jgi:hypothetical protein
MKRPILLYVVLGFLAVEVARVAVAIVWWMFSRKYGPSLSPAWLLINLATVLVGAFFAARLAGASAVRASAVVGAVFFALRVADLVLYRSPVGPSWVRIADLILVVPVALAGGYLAAAGLTSASSGRRKRIR